MAQVTKKDVKEAVEKKVEDEFRASVEKRIRRVQKEYYMKPSTVIDKCPYCNEVREFPNTRIIKNVGGEPHLVLRCPVCGNTVYAHFKINEEGDVFSGYSYECTVTMKKAEEIGEKPYRILKL